MFWLLWPLTVVSAIQHVVAAPIVAAEAAIEATKGKTPGYGDYPGSPGWTR